MNISYDEVKVDSEKLIDAALSSTNTIPSFFAPLGYLKYHLLAYVAFSALALYIPDVGGDVMMVLGVLIFGFLNWLFIFGFASGYVTLFAMVSNPAVRGLKLTKIISAKLKVYGIAWLALIFILGLVSIVSDINIGALVFGNFVFSILGFFILNIDLSRYQLSALMGAVSAIKDKAGY